MKKEEQKAKIAKELASKLGTPAVTQAEVQVRTATTNYLAGDKMSEIERTYGIKIEQITSLLRRTFPAEADRFEFMQNCMMANSVMAMAQFEKTHTEMDAIDSAKAATLFAGKALDFKKAREAGFKEQPVSVGIILQLQETLNAIQTKEA